MNYSGLLSPPIPDGRFYKCLLSALPAKKHKPLLVSQKVGPDEHLQQMLFWQCSSGCPDALTSIPEREEHAREREGERGGGGGGGGGGVWSRGNLIYQMAEFER